MKPTQLSELAQVSELLKNPEKQALLEANLDTFRCYSIGDKIIIKDKNTGKILFGVVKSFDMNPVNELILVVDVASDKTPWYLHPRHGNFEITKI